MSLCGANAQGPLPDRAVKAAFVARFPDFVTWPVETPGSTFRVCLSPSHDFKSAVSDATRGLKVRGRASEVKHLTTTDALTGCHLLYVASTDTHLLSQARRLPLLTVGEESAFCQRGGIINLVVVEGRVRFEVSLDHARAAGLTIDTQLLRLALRVYGGRP